MRLRLEPGAPDWYLSLERLNPLGGYTRTNCALICLELNSHVQLSRAVVQSWRTGEPSDNVH